MVGIEAPSACVVSTPYFRSVSRQCLSQRKNMTLLTKKVSVALWHYTGGEFTWSLDISIGFIADETGPASDKDDMKNRRKSTSALPSTKPKRNSGTLPQSPAEPSRQRSGSSYEPPKIPAAAGPRPPSDPIAPGAMQQVRSEALLKETQTCCVCSSCRKKEHGRRALKSRNSNVYCKLRRAVVRAVRPCYCFLW